MHRLNGLSLNTILLGNAWACNSINTVIFRHHAILTIGRFQIAGYYESSTVIKVVMRDLRSGAMFAGNIKGQYNVADAHNSISLGVDRDSYIHIAYDQHTSKLRYRRSLSPLSVHGWTEELGMSGKNEERLTYPCFLMSPKKKQLLMLYRDGLHDRGMARIKEYSESTLEWTDREPAILSGIAQTPWTSNAYWNHPAISSDGAIHLSFVWRTHYIPDTEKRINNIDIDYAKSTDYGRSWRSSRNRSFKLPITQVNSETIFPISPGSNLINQTSMALDSKGNPHIVFYSDDPENTPQYQHLWFDGRVWRHSYISQRRTAFMLGGGGTLKIPISRPEIVIDSEDRVYVIYRGDMTQERMVAQRLLPTHYLPNSSDVKVLWRESVGFSEPVIDRLRWQRDNMLSMLVQKCDQPNRDHKLRPVFEPIYIMDWDLVGSWK